MILSESTECVISFLKEIAKKAKKVEVLKELLIDKSTFHPNHLFKAISSSSKISFSCLNSFLKEQGTKVNISYFCFFFTEIDVDKDEQLNFSEFLSIVTPTNENALRQLYTEINNKPDFRPKKVTPDIIKLFVEIIKIELEIVSTIHKKVKELEKIPSFGTYDFFSFLNRNNDGKLSKKEYCFNKYHLFLRETFRICVNSRYRSYFQTFKRRPRLYNMGQFQKSVQF